MDVDLTSYLSNTGIEEEYFNEKKESCFHSLNYSSEIKRGLISEVILGKNCPYQVERVRQFLNDNGILCAVMESEL